MTRDEEVALLGVLESQLGERQRAMNGLHLSTDTAQEIHAGMIRLQRAVQAAADSERGAGRLPRHRRSVSPATLAVLAVAGCCLVGLVLLLVALGSGAGR